MQVILLRHADRTSDGADALSVQGVERARLLARMLGESGVSAAFCSDAARTMQTMAPLKDKLGTALAVTPIPTSGPGGLGGHIAKTVAAVKSLPPAAIAVVVGHTNTIDKIIAGLGGGAIAAIAETEFDRLFVLSIATSGETSLLKLRYGQPTP